MAYQDGRKNNLVIKISCIMSNISFQGNPQQAVAAAGGVLAAIAAAPAWLLVAAGAAAVGGVAYAINKANKEEKK